MSGDGLVIDPYVAKALERAIELQAVEILTERGLTGSLRRVTPHKWQFSGLKGVQGASVEIEGEPDAELLTEAADMIAAELAA